MITVEEMDPDYQPVRRYLILRAGGITYSGYFQDDMFVIAEVSHQPLDPKGDYRWLYSETYCDIKVLSELVFRRYHLKLVRMGKQLIRYQPSKFQRLTRYFAYRQRSVIVAAILAAGIVSYCSLYQFLKHTPMPLWLQQFLQ